MPNPKRPYICGPLTDLPVNLQAGVKQLYQNLAEVCQEELGVRGYVPHEHTDPIMHASISAAEVHDRDKQIVCNNSDYIIAVPLFPSTGAGMEIGWAEDHMIPVILLLPAGKKITRLVLGSPAVVARLEFETLATAPEVLRKYFRSQPAGKNKPRKKHPEYKDLRDRLVAEIAQ